MCIEFHRAVCVADVLKIGNFQFMWIGILLLKSVFFFPCGEVSVILEGGRLGRVSLGK